MRSEIFFANLASALTVYGGKFAAGDSGTLFWGSNHIYGLTVVSNGFGPASMPMYSWNGSAYVFDHTVDNTPWLPAITTANSTNDIFRNCLLVGNYLDQINSENGIGLPIVSNNVTLTTPAAAFADMTAGNATNFAQPDFHLLASSAGIDAGSWLTTATSGGSGTNLSVADAAYFFGGLTNVWRSIPGDTIQLQGQTNTATIISISGQTLVLNSALSWTNGQGVSLAYNGLAPDAGAFEFSGTNTPAVGGPFRRSIKPATSAAAGVPVQVRGGGRLW